MFSQKQPHSNKKKLPNFTRKQSNFRSKLIQIRPQKAKSGHSGEMHIQNLQFYYWKNLWRWENLLKKCLTPIDIQEFKRHKSHVCEFSQFSGFFRSCKEKVSTFLVTNGSPKNSWCHFTIMAVYTQCVGKNYTLTFYVGHFAKAVVLTFPFFSNFKRIKDSFL